MKDYWWYWILCATGMTLYVFLGVPLEHLIVPALIVGLGYVIKNIEELKKK